MELEDNKAELIVLMEKCEPNIYGMLDYRMYKGMVKDINIKIYKLKQRIK